MQEEKINTEKVTLGDCIDMYRYKEMSSEINDGKLECFKQDAEHDRTLYHNIYK